MLSDSHCSCLSQLKHHFSTIFCLHAFTLATCREQYARSTAAFTFACLPFCLNFSLCLPFSTILFAVLYPCTTVLEWFWVACVSSPTVPPVCSPPLPSNPRLRCKQSSRKSKIHFVAPLRYHFSGRLLNFLFCMFVWPTSIHPLSMLKCLLNFFLFGH